MTRMPSSNPKLRVGLLVDSCEVTAWEYKMIERVQLSEYADIVLVVVNAAPRPAKSFWRRLRNFWNHGFYSLYERLEQRLFRPRPDAFAPRDATELLRAADRIDVTPREKKFSDAFSDVDVTSIESYELDVMVRLGFRILRGRILQTAACGVWSYHHGDNQVNRGGPAGFWEVLLGQPVTGSMLQILSEDLDGGLSLYRSYSATDEVSVRRNRNKLYWKSAAFVPRTLQELHRVGRDAFMTKVRRQNDSLSFYCHRLYVTPGNLEFVGLILRHFCRRLWARFNKIFSRDQWFLLMDNNRSRFPTSLWRFKEIMAPRDRFWADPCAVENNGKHYVFVEEFLYDVGRGHISVLEVERQTEPRAVLRLPHHLSYPFVFEWQGTHYMIPECASQRKVVVFRCETFPDSWQYHCTLLHDVVAVDTTLFPHDGRWWMFCNMVEYPGASSWDELFLFYADNPLTDKWSPHPQNPIVSDVRRARPAGGVFIHEGRLIRPAQDSSRVYGYGVRMNEIVVLTPEEYEERPMSSIEPLWDPRLEGVHTFSRAGTLTVADAKRKRFKFF